MIKLSDLKDSLDTANTLTSLYLSDNIVETVPTRNLVVDGYSALEIKATGGFKINNSPYILPGQVWTAVSPQGDGYWTSNPNNLNSAYTFENEITTSEAYGNVVILGTKALEVTANNGIIASLIQTSGANNLQVKTPNDILVSGDTTIIDGYKFYLPQTSSPATPGKVWTAMGISGEGYWSTPVSDLQGAYVTNNIITTDSLNGNVVINGSEALRVESNLNVPGDAYFTGLIRYNVGSPTSGKVWTAANSLGDGYWQVPVSDLQGAYVTNNVITTDNTNGNLTFSGTEKVVINTTGGLQVTTPLDFSGSVKIQSGTPAIGKVFTASSASGDGYWNTLPDATNSSRGLISKEFSSAEQTLAPTLTWDGGNDPIGLVYKLYKWTRVSNRVDVWFIAEYTTPNGSGSGKVSFQLPTDCPPPALWSVTTANETLTHGTGKLITTTLGTDIIDHTNEVSLYYDGSNYYVSIASLARVSNVYGTAAATTFSPIGFNAHITYFV